MAQPGRRRPGFSRRAQFGLFITYVLSIASVIAGALILLFSRADPQRFAVARTTVADVAAPILSALRAPIVGTERAMSAVADYFGAIDRNRRLEAELTAARPQLVKAQLLERENRRLRDLLSLAEPNERRVAVARIVTSAPGSVVRTALIAAGARQGVAVEQPVRAPAGLVGRVIETGQGSARVLMIQDSASRVPATLVRDGTPALVTGTNGAYLDVRTVITDRNPFRAGDLLVTSGAGGIFPPDVPVAVIVERTQEGAIARPAARPERLDHVLIERPYAPPPPKPGRPPSPGNTAP